MLMSITSSRSSRYGKIASTGVSRLRVIPTRMPVPRAFAIDRRGVRDRLVMERDDVETRVRELVEEAFGASTMRCPWNTRSVTGRSEATTTGPIVSGGTKCASMTSIWMTSAYGSTSLTWSARCAKSADRIEAESMPIGAIVPARSGAVCGRPRRTCRRNRADAATGGPAGMGRPDRRSPRAPARVDAGRTRRTPRPSRRAGTCTPSRRGGPRDGAGRRPRTRWPPGAARGRRGRPAVAARAARAAGAPTRCRSTARPPAPGRTSRAIAGRVASCATTSTGTWSRSAVLRTRAARSGRTSPATTRPVSPTRHADVRRLAAGCGADVEHAVARLRIERADDERRRLVLDGEPALREAAQTRRVAAVEEHAVRVEPRRLRGVTARAESPDERVDRRDAGVHAEAEEPALAERLRRHLRLVVAEEQTELLHRPRRHAGARRDGLVGRPRRRPREDRRRASGGSRSRTRARAGWRDRPTPRPRRATGSA